MKKTTSLDRYERHSAKLVALRTIVEQRFGVSLDNVPEAPEIGPLPGDDIDIDQLLAEQEGQPLRTSSTPRRKASPSALTSTTERICVRVPHYVLDALRKEAEARGMGYQTVLNEALRTYLTANIQNA